ncbi:CLIP domain-containing serine protease B4-like [Ochlerotatus camptorhynchus]|uniref:CLIP domain-containing serine protease B4-like n=1 Tax=Ochlerotatus camptorhynchus TaxID=644619 RepID=UPI0031DB7C56
MLRLLVVLFTAVFGLGHCLSLNVPNKVAIEGSTCQAGDVIGQCVGVREYPEYLAILRKSIRTEQETAFLYAQFCGYTTKRKPLVCHPVQLNEPECGAQFTDRIIKGTLARLDEYPWMALFQYSKPYNKTGFHCGGVLINKRFVLSAAHCFVGLRFGWEASKVRLGEWDCESDQDCTGIGPDRDCALPVQEFDLERIMLHEGFSVRDQHKANDIALVRLARDAEYNHFVKPICLPEPGCVPKMTRLYDGVLVASGWGKTENVSSSRYKLYTELWSTDSQSCKESYAKGIRVLLTEAQICAGGKDGQDTCNGDSGGPLMKEVSEQGRHYVIGVVSFGPKKCGEQLPGVYTKVEHYHQWIVQKVIESS